VPEDEDYLVPIGVADVKRAGTHATIVCHSKTVAPALNAAKKLEDDGLDVEVIDLRTIRPLDEAAVLASVRKTHRLVIAEEGWGFAGVGAQVADLVQREAFDDLDAPIIRVHQADVPMPYNKHLEKAAKVDAVKIAAAGVLVFVVAAALLSEFDTVTGHFGDLGLIALLLCVCSLLVGYLVPRAFGVAPADAVAAGMEIGVHNAALAITIATTVLGNETMAVPAGLYGFLMNIPASIAAVLFARSRRASVPAGVAPPR